MTEHLRLSNLDDREVLCDVEGNIFTLRFPTAEEAARFRTKVLVGGLLVGALMSPTMALGSSPSSGSTTSAGAASVTSSGEDHAMGSAVAWTTREAASR